MDNLVSILDSYQTGWGKKKYVRDFIHILRDLLIPSHSSLNARIENNKAVFSQGWNQIVSALKEARIFELFIPPDYGGRKTSEEDIYFLMELFRVWASCSSHMGEALM